jgi:hypothetical protein
MEDTKKTPVKRAWHVKKPEPIVGSEEAKRQAAVVLEVMSGSRGAQEGADVLGISAIRYYTLENRALQGMVKALEPRPKGRRMRSPEDAMRQVEKEREQYKREVGRLQTLLRMVRKSVHLQEPRLVRGVESKEKGKKVRKPLKRVEKLIERLKPAESAPAAEAAAEA